MHKFKATILEKVSPQPGTIEGLFIAHLATTTASTPTALTGLLIRLSGQWMASLCEP